MNCVACGEPAGFNRVVIDLVRDQEIGGLCVGCERESFGRVLENGEWQEENSCVLCSRDGHFGLPEWHAETIETRRGLVSINEYEMTRATVRLCDEHVHTVSRDRTGMDSHRRTLIEST